MEHEHPWKENSGPTAATQPSCLEQMGTLELPDVSPGEMGKGSTILWSFPVGKVCLGPPAPKSAMNRHTMHQCSPATAGAGEAVGSHGERKTQTPFLFPRSGEDTCALNTHALL